MKHTVFSWTKNWLVKKNIPFHFFEQTDSSSDRAKEQAFQTVEPFSVFLAVEQKKGRGRHLADWQDSDLMISFLWQGDLKEIRLESCEEFSQDLKKALQAVWPKLPARVKAPNDLYLDQGKAAGILLEPLSQGSQKALVLGLGLNVFSCPKDLPSACLSDHTDNINMESWELFLEKLFLLWSKRALA